MNGITLAIVFFIIGMFADDKSLTNSNHENFPVYPRISELSRQLRESLKIYDSSYDFPFDDIIFSDENAFSLLKNSYKNIEFYGDFEPGDLVSYDYFKLNFLRLLNNEVRFTRKETGETMYLKEFDESYSSHDNKYSYYFFDMDEDGTPELCINDYSLRIDIYKYNPDHDEFILIHELHPSYYQLNGSNKIRWDGAGGSGYHGVFYKYNELSEEEYSAAFLYQPHYNERLGKSEVVYMAGLPQYTNKSEQIMIPDNIKKQAYIDKSYGTFYFRLTEEQYDDLTGDYHKAARSAAETLREMAYTYDELFAQ